MPDIFLCRGSKTDQAQDQKLKLKKKEPSHLGKCDASCFSCFLFFVDCYILFVFGFVKNLPIEQWNKGHFFSNCGSIDPRGSFEGDDF